MADEAKKTIRLSQHDRVIAGVCGGIGHFLKLDSSIVRIIFILSCFILAGFPILLYFLLWIILPQESLQEALTEEEKDKLVKQDKSQRKKAGMFLSIIFALFLILIGVVMIVPESKLILKDAGIIILSFAFLVLAVKIATVMIQDKKTSPVSLAIIIILGTMAFFIPLISFDILKFGVLVEYAKFTLPALLILGGIIIILNSTKEDWARLLGVILTIAIFLGLGVLSIIKGNYTLAEKFPKHAEWSNWMNWSDDNSAKPGNFIYQIPDKESYSYYDYKIEHKAGAMKIDSHKGAFEIKGRGAMPSISTNLKDGILSLELDSKAGDSRMSLPESKKGDLSVEIKAGDIRAHLEDVEIRKLNIYVAFGSGHFTVGPLTRKINVEIKAGDTELELPEDSDIRINVQNQHSYIDLPRGFIFSENAYIYKGKGGEEIIVDANIKAGSLRIDLE